MDGFAGRLVSAQRKGTNRKRHVNGYECSKISHHQDELLADNKQMYLLFIVSLYSLSEVCSDLLFLVVLLAGRKKFYKYIHNLTEIQAEEEISYCKTSYKERTSVVQLYFVCKYYCFAPNLLL